MRGLACQRMPLAGARGAAQQAQSFLAVPTAGGRGDALLLPPWLRAWCCGAPALLWRWRTLLAAAATAPATGCQARRGEHSEAAALPCRCTPRGAAPRSAAHARAACIAQASQARLCGRLLLRGLLSVAAGPVLVHVRFGRPWRAGVRVIWQAAELDASDARRMDA
jgi:hypothetical protein